MQEIKTASWVETRTRWEAPQDEISLSTQHWLRTTPPAKALHIDHGESWSQYVWEERGHLHTVSTWEHCDLKPHLHPFDVETLLRRVLFLPPDQNASPARPELKWRHEPDAQEEGVLLRWHREYVQDNFLVSESVWTEPENHRIVRKECRQTDPPNGMLVAVIVCDRYTYNEEPPAGTFEMPEGKPIVARDGTHAMPEVWDALSVREQQAIQTVISRSDAGWRDADFAAFGSVWQFDFVRLVPREAEWRERVQQNGLWSHWESVVETVSLMKFVPVTVALLTFQFSPERRKILWARVKIRVTRDGEANAWEGRADFYLRRRGRGFRIVHWECPWEEIRAASNAQAANRET